MRPHVSLLILANNKRGLRFPVLCPRRRHPGRPGYRVGPLPAGSVLGATSRAQEAAGLPGIGPHRNPGYGTVGLQGDIERPGEDGVNGRIPRLIGATFVHFQGGLGNHGKGDSGLV